MELLLASGQALKADQDVTAALQGRTLALSPEGVRNSHTGTLITTLLRQDRGGRVLLRNSDALDLRRENLEAPGWITK